MYFPIDNCFSSLKIKKVFSRLVVWVCATVSSFRLSDFHPHEMWCSQHFLSSSFIIFFSAHKSSHYSISMDCSGTPFLLYFFFNFIPQLFFFILLLFFSSFCLPLVWLLPCINRFVNLYLTSITNPTRIRDPN